jgi:hypothetical protein
VTALRRWPAHLPVPILAIGLVLGAAACGPTGPTPRSTANAAPSVAPSLTPVPGGSTGARSPSGSVSQTDTQTEVGRIWDALPKSFPRIAGAVPIETGSGPTSGTFAVGTDLASALATIRAGLTGLGYNVDVGSPLEDGTVVLDAGGGDEPECRIEVRFTPLSGTITMAVLYGAACPFS